MRRPGILDDLLATLPDEPVPVRSVLVGAHWTGVCSTRCGLATTIIGNKPHDKTGIVRDAGRLHNKSAQELAAFALSENFLEAGIGVAAINSLLPVDEREAVEMNASEVLMKEGAGKNVALVGHFPFIPRLRPVCENLWVIEQHPSGDDRPASSAPGLIPRADVVAITASALINHTLDDLLTLCSPQALVMILGPSTPLSPVLFDHGATVIAGSWVVDEDAVLNSIGQGATFQQVSGVRLLAFHARGAVSRDGKKDIPGSSGVNIP
jgi:uncharacterized protein (DUF4213/DUF364 family)